MWQPWRKSTLLTSVTFERPNLTKQSWDCLVERFCSKASLSCLLPNCAQALSWSFLQWSKIPLATSHTQCRRYGEPRGRSPLTAACAPPNFDFTKKQTNYVWNITQPVAYAGFWKGGARNFRKFERNIDQNLKLSYSNFAQNQVKSKKKRSSLKFRPNFRPKLGEEQKKKKKKGLHSNFVPIFAQIHSNLEPIAWKPDAQLAKGGAMPKFGSLFYAILQSWQPKRGPWPKAPP